MESELLWVILSLIFSFFIMYNICCKNNQNQIIPINNSNRRISSSVIIDINEENNEEEEENIENILNMSVDFFNEEFEKKLKNLKTVKIKDHPGFTEDLIECPISFDSFNFEEEVYLISCKHIFKKKDLEKLLRLKNECPICRKEVFQ